MSILYSIFISPLEVIYGHFYALCVLLTGNYGVSLLLLSVFSAVIFIPLGRMAAIVQNKEKKIQGILAPQIARIRAESTGVRRHERISALYRRYAYHPIYAMRSAMGVALQAPFLTVAYLVLIKPAEIRGRSFLMIPDLGRPDGLLGGINALPLLMTVVNIVAAYTTPNFTKRDRVQAVCIAGLFLALLYNALSALLIFWTCNNLIFLVQNLIPEGLFSRMRVPNLLRWWKLPGPETRWSVEKSGNLYGLGAVIIALLFTTFAPSALYLSDPKVFNVSFGVVLSKTLFMPELLFIFAAVFWIVCPVRWRSIVTMLMLFATCLLFINGVVLPGKYGEINGGILTGGSRLSLPHLWLRDLIPALIALAVVGVLYVFRLVRYTMIPLSIVAGTLALFPVFVFFATMDLKGAQNNNGAVVADINGAQEKTASILPSYNDRLYSFSRDGKNVLVIILDMFTGGHMEELLAKWPELRHQLNGFVWYPDTLSIGSYTALSLPSIYGGHDYSPSAMNARTRDAPLSEQTCQAYAVLPRNFADKGYDIALANPVLCADKKRLAQYAGHEESILSVSGVGKDYLPFLMKHENMSIPSTSALGGTIRNFIVATSIFRIVPHVMKRYVYGNGGWLGSNYGFMIEKAREELAELYAMSYVSTANSKKNTFKIIYDHLTHGPWFLAADSLRLVEDPFPETQGQATMVNGILPEHLYTEHHAMRLLVDFFDWMKRERVYNNTRIIITSDHDFADSRMLNRALGVDETNQTSPWLTKNAYPGWPHALLLVKEENSKGDMMMKSDVFMSNADVAQLACLSLAGGCRDLPREDPRQQGRAPRILYHHQYQLGDQFYRNNLYNFKRYQVKGSIFKKENWGPAP